MDDAKSVAVDGIYVYSFLQEGAGNDPRLAKDLEVLRQTVTSVLEDKGVRVGSRAVPSGALTLDNTPRGRNGIEGFERVLQDQSKANAAEIAHQNRNDEVALPASYRLLLLPEKVVRSTGMYWGTRSISSAARTWFSYGAQASGVPNYSFRVYWVLEDVSDKPIAAGTTTGTADIRGFPSKPMAEQMAAELEKLDIHWSPAEGGSKAEP